MADSGLVRRCIVMFDGFCPRCRQLASLVVCNSAGRVTAMNLREAHAAALLDEVVGPGRELRPYVVFTRGDTRKAVSGWRALLALVFVLGLARSWRLYREARQVGIKVLPKGDRGKGAPGQARRGCA